MRVTVSVERRAEDWHVRIEVPVGGDGPIEHAMARRPQAPFVAPLGGNMPEAGEPHAQFASVQAADELSKLANDVLTRRAGRERIELYGRHLFASLIGRGPWPKILDACAGAGSLELALRWDAGEEELHAPIWEALHDGKRFLSAYDRCAVAITRVVADAMVEGPETIATSPRVLFAIGNDLADRSIRPGAEFVGLMREVRNDGNPMTPYVLERASLKRIAEAVGGFRPDAVHFICHGQIAAGIPRLLLSRDEKGTNGRETSPATADEVYDSLASKGTPPRIAIVSACETATGGSLAPTVGGPAVTPFAVSLVRAGVPIVVAMSGRVADAACRLFTRKFGSILANGGELVAAAADARRAAYFETDTPGTIDWLLPAVFLAERVAHNYAPFDATAGGTLRARMDAYDLAWKPVFCGRREFFDAYDELVDPSTKLAVLVAWWRDPGGVGKERLLRELAARALADGHIPVLVMPAQSPRNAQQLGAHLGIAIEQARQHFGLSPGTESSLLSLARAECPDLGAASPGDRAQIFSQLSKLRDREDSALGALAVAEAIRTDLAALADAARATKAIVPASGAFVLLGDVDTWDSAREALFDEVLGPHGMGTQVRPVPIVLTWKADGLSGEQFDSERRQAQGPLWKRFLELAPLAEEEEILAYQWVLANAWPELGDQYAKQVWLVESPDGKWRDEFRNYISGLPRRFREPIFWLLASKWAAEDEFVCGDDERLLQRYVEWQKEQTGD